MNLLETYPNPNWLYYLNLINLGVLPSFIWLSYFLRKDVHPESNDRVIKIFFYGMLIAIPTIVIEKGINDFLFYWLKNDSLIQFLYIFLGVAFVEEFLKYLVVKEKILVDPEFDEPIDLPLYLIIAALGFAALENTLYLLRIEDLKDLIIVVIFRFLGAIFLHALCSGILGYFWVISFYNSKKQLTLLTLAITISTLLHGFFNFGIIKMEENSIFFLLPTTILIGQAVFLSLGLKRLKKIKSICKIN